jgi:hypothetical protein
LVKRQAAGVSEDAKFGGAPERPLTGPVVATEHNELGRPSWLKPASGSSSSSTVPTPQIIGFNGSSLWHFTIDPDVD